MHWGNFAFSSALVQLPFEECTGAPARLEKKTCKVKKVGALRVCTGQRAKNATTDPWCTGAHSRRLLLLP